MITYYIIISLGFRVGWTQPGGSHPGPHATVGRQWLGQEKPLRHPLQGRTLRPQLITPSTASPCMGSLTLVFIKVLLRDGRCGEQGGLDH